MENIQLGLWPKTSPDSSTPIEDLQWRESSKRWPKQGRWSLNGPCWTHNGSEFPNDGDESSSHLASILQQPEDVQPKYFLSQKAAAGILRRSSRRGKKLPELLEAALEAVAGPLTPTE
jgi:hypothetical protein